jgi:TonB family protein
MHVLACPAKKELMSDQPHDVEKFLQVSDRDAQQSGGPAHFPERRIRPRRRVASLEYVDLGGGNGGIIINLGEDGMYVQAVGGLADAELPLITFRVPESGHRVETSGQVIWTGESKKDAGIQFVNLPEDARAKIKEWVTSEKRAVEHAYELDAMPGTIRKSRERIPEIPRPRPPQKIAPKPLVSGEIVPSGAQLSDPSAILNPGIFDSAAPLDRSAPDDFAQEPSAGTAPPSRIAAAYQSARLYVQHQSRVGLATILVLVAGVSLLAGWIATRPSDRKQALASNSSQTAGQPAPSNIAQPPVTSAATRVPGAPVQNPPSRDQAGNPATQSVANVASSAPKSVSPRSAEVNSLSASTANPLPDRNSHDRAVAPPPVRTTAPVSSTSAVNSTPAPRPASPPHTDVVTPAPSAPTNANAAHPQSVPSAQAPPSVSTAASLNSSGPNINQPPVTQTPALAAKLPPSAPVPTPQKPPEAAPEIVKSSVSVSASPYPSIRVPPELKAQLSRAGGSLQIGQLISRVEPIYPESAERERIEGLVKLRAIIGTDGAVRGIEDSSGPPPLVSAATTAVRQWRYTPTSLGGQPVEAGVTITIVFRLQISGPPQN